jgi:2-phospho-L-lactate/phosphoenolpyruvate guanylyltransferase
MVSTALVPIRMGPVAKRRLAHVADAPQRVMLVRDLFEHVTGVLLDAGLDVIALAPHALSASGVQIWHDAAPGLNAAVDEAVGRTGVPVLIVHGDLPVLSVADVHAVLESDADVVIGRATDGGTNALLLRRSMRVAFGRGSALAHARRARAAGLRTAVIDRPGLAVDVDDEAALIAWRGAASQRRRS